MLGVQPEQWQVWQRRDTGNLSEVAALDYDPETGEVIGVVLRSIRHDAFDEPPGLRHLTTTCNGRYKPIGHTRKVLLKVLWFRFRLYATNVD